MDMLSQFTQWVNKQSAIAKQQGFMIEINIHESYFTQIFLDNDEFIAEITFWKNYNLFHVEILSTCSEEHLYINSGEYDPNIKFSDFFSDFLERLQLKNEYDFN
ncbi:MULTISPECIES: immunity protein TriTu family protein [Acinetobacter]|uniref:DUF4268 domain-containing protein n=1 Tax=Acinetobacter baylyi (strain ATCC 33305 / BD413 / ADP1) TaxID=62977 RepID=Q6F8S1_ACIAD|nr:MULTISPECIES: hypothetical protein [Acinetobacter]ENV53463.1 hypothetical protein F952_02524 [Acinetobacter baylyi DSM 14961 = CIP 107474]KAF2370808.1 hypothetical protein BSL88_09355 [Acinetobacter baylyi]KAF2375056.1 hypothetical protein BSL67_01785 [Acinetobacter baylyi]KAF2378401.1 hypothetical protein BSN81_03065 [Acinetobacter baylyi]KAF2380106.1 hypothetical protein BSN83_12520 [Acinetobacter baylyi]